MQKQIPFGNDKQKERATASATATARSNSNSNSEKQILRLRRRMTSKGKGKGKGNSNGKCKKRGDRDRRNTNTERPLRMLSRSGLSNFFLCVMSSGDEAEPRNAARLVAVSRAYRDLMAALRAAAAQNRGTCLGLHAAEEAVGLGAMAAVGLKRTLGHGTLFSCISELGLLWHEVRVPGCGAGRFPECMTGTTGEQLQEDWRQSKAQCTATISEYT
jgi:hypothetical protein